MTLRPSEISRQHQTEAYFLDGVIPQAQKIECWIEKAADMLAIRTDTKTLYWKLDDVRAVPDQGGKDLLVLRTTSEPLPRVLLTDPSYIKHLPKARKTPPVTKRGKLVAWSFAALASVAIIIFGLVPLMANQLAGFIPPEGEQALGDVTLTQIREALTDEAAPISFCADTDGTRALQRMQDRLVEAQAFDTPLQVHVLDHKMINAFALPGGHIVFFRGLIDKAETPEEIAAVFAHEIGHVVSRDPTRHALRSAGSIGVLGLLFGDFAGGALVLFLTEQLIEAQYSQGAEAAADSFAYDMLLQAEISPAALGTMFERFLELGGETDGITAHFMSHPALGDRIEKARNAEPAGFEAQPILTPKEWRDLQTICGDSHERRGKSLKN